MKIDITPEEFEQLSNEKKKKYIAHLFIRKSGAKPVVRNAIKKFANKAVTQEDLAAFLFDEHTLSTAARGSMDKRNALLDKAQSESK